MQTQKVQIAAILPNPCQPRLVYRDAYLSELSESIKKHGLLTPIIVRPRGGDLELVAGSCRVRAALRAGWTEIEAVVRAVDDLEAALLAGVENQRENLSAMEWARYMARLKEMYLERGHTPGSVVSNIAVDLSLSETTVRKHLRLLDLPADIQELAVQEGWPLSKAEAKVKGASRKASGEETGVPEREPAGPAPVQEGKGEAAHFKAFSMEEEELDAFLLDLASAISLANGRALRIEQARVALEGMGEKERLEKTGRLRVTTEGLEVTLRKVKRLWEDGR